MNKKRPWAKRKATWHKWFVANRETRNKRKRASYQVAKLNALPPAELLKVLSGGVFVRHGKGTHQIYRINNRMVVVSLSRPDYRSDNQPCVASDGNAMTRPAPRPEMALKNFVGKDNANVRIFTVRI